MINYTLPPHTPSKKGKEDHEHEAADSDAESIYDAADNALTDVESAATPLSNQGSPDSLFSRNRGSTKGIFNLFFLVCRLVRNANAAGSSPIQTCENY